MAAHTSALLGAPISRHRICLATWVLCLCASASAATPDAGMLLRQELRLDQAPATRPALPSVTPAEERAEAESGPQIQVSAFRVVGLQTVAEVDAQQLLAKYVGQSSSLKGLQRVGQKLEQWLRAKGLFMARAYVPQQDIKGGVVELRVVEGRVEGVDIKRAPGTRQSDDSLLAIVTGAIPAGAALEQEQLERGLLLANDLPAASVRAVLVPGAEQGGVRVVVEAAQGAVVSGNVELDNTGNRLTGAWRAVAALFVNDAYGGGDLWSMRITASQGTSFVRAGYTTPLGSDGWKAGLALIGSSYKLCCELPANTPDSDGAATSASAYVSYPLIRTRMRNLSAWFNLASRDFVNRQLGTASSDRNSTSFTIGLAGDASDLTGLLGLGAYTTYSAQSTSGQLDLDRVASDQAADAAQAQSQGRYAKWTGQVTHLLRASKTAALYASVSAQWANKNLDSSEKFVLGGSQGVRAYPSGEGSGDQGWLLNAEWRNDLAAQWGMVAFVDYGRVSLHHSPWGNWNISNPNQDNSYALAGLGVSAVWTPQPRTQFTATLATKLGDNAGRDVNGRDSDNTDARARVWVRGSWAF